MDTNLQYSYQVPDLKTRFLIGFGNIMEQIIGLLTYSDISTDTQTFDDEELKSKLRAAIAYALGLLAATFGFFYYAIGIILLIADTSLLWT